MSRLTLFLAMTLLSVVPISGADVPRDSPARWRNPKDGMEFIRIPPGELAVEAPAASGQGGGGVTQSVAFATGFWIGRTEVTVRQFRRFAEATGYVTSAEKDGNLWTWRRPGFAQTGRHPVVYLSMPDAEAYARWAGVDLPTQSEWLYGCRAGAATRYPWGDTMDDRFAWYRANTQGTGTRPVARKRPNRWGLHDMVGNAWEYCRVNDDTCWVTMGAAWTRCVSYRGREGEFTWDLIADSVAPRLNRCDPNPQFAPYPWDDDRGFRCVRRDEPGPMATESEPKKTAKSPRRSFRAR